MGRPFPIQENSMTIIGVNAGNEPVDYQDFNTWVGGRLGLVSVFTDQRSEAQFVGATIPYQVPQGALVQKAVPGSILKYSLSFPGAAADKAQAVAEGRYDGLYKDILKAILAKNPGTGRIIIRLPWEFNLQPSFQNQSAMGTGDFFSLAWRRLALLIRTISPTRFWIEWCPNVGKQQIDPDLFFQWAELYDILSQDIYIPDQSWVNPGLASWYLHDGGGRGCDWLVNIAIQKGKLYSWAEWAVESERHAAEMQVLCDFVKSVPGSTFHHHAYWSRGDGPITGKLHDNSKPTLAAIYKSAFCS